MQEKYFFQNDKYDIRFNKRSKHFSIIIGKKKKAFIFLTLTHTSKYKKNHHLPLLYNPNKNDNNESYVDKQIRRSKIFNFGKIKKDYVLNNLDKVLVDVLIIEPYLERQKAREEKENKLKKEQENQINEKKDFTIENDKEVKKEKIIEKEK